MLKLEKYTYAELQEYLNQLYVKIEKLKEIDVDLFSLAGRLQYHLDDLLPLYKISIDDKKHEYLTCKEVNYIIDVYMKERL